MGSQLLWETNYFTSKKVYIWWKSSEEIQNIVSSIWSYDALKNVKKNCKLKWRIKRDSFLSIRDRFRTVVNVLGDAIGAGIVEHLSRDELMNADQSKMEEGGEGVDGEAIELMETSQGKYTRKDPDSGSVGVQPV